MTKFNNYIDLRKYLLDIKYWSYYENTEYHRTGHLYYNSPFETDNSCGNCDGARCDSCKKVFDNNIVCNGIPVDELEDIAREEGCPKDIINALVYDDSYNPSKHDGWKFLWPAWTDMKIRYPEETAKMEKLIMEKHNEY